MAINVDKLSPDQARDYYLNYLSGKDKSGIGEQVSKSAKWNGFLDDWSSDSTSYDIDKKNLKSASAGASLGMAAGSALTTGVGSFLGAESGYSFFDVAKGVKKDGLSYFKGTKNKAAVKNGDKIDKAADKGPGSTVHAIMMAVSSTLGMISALVTQAAQKKSIEDQNKVIQATQKEFEYDFNAKMMEADQQKEYAAMQYDNALAVIEENEGHAALSDAVSGALADSNKGLSEVAANRSSEIRSETGQELTEIADDIYSQGGTIPNNVDEFSKKAELSDLMVPYGQQATSVNKQNKIAMYLSGAAAIFTSLQCVTGMALSGPQWWNYIIYGAALAMAITTSVIGFMEAKKATEAQGKSELFTANSEMLGNNARAATEEAKSKQSEYDDFATQVSELSQAYGGTGGEVQAANSSGLA